MRPSAVFFASNRRTPVRVEVERLFVQPLSADATVIRSILPNCERCPHSTPPVPSYAARGGLRVDFLTPNEGGETGQPQALPALRTDAQPLRFLDFLIHEPEPAVILHHAGIFVQVPTPARLRRSQVDCIAPASRRACEARQGYSASQRPARSACRQPTSRAQTRLGGSLQ